VQLLNNGLGVNPTGIAADHDFKIEGAVLDYLQTVSASKKHYHYTGIQCS